ncbi:MAG: winged helix-turn-helix domain-containing protein, partial [Pyrinomonadaceae bacterium]
MTKIEEKKICIYRFGCFEVNAKEKLLRSGGEVVPLTPKIFEMLLLLIQNNGRMLSKDEIMESVWADSFVEETNLTSNISRLRKILDNGGEKFIETFPKRGYRFRAEIEETEPETEILLTRRVTTRVCQITEEDEATSLRLNEADRMKSIAVLPFVTLGMETDEEYLGLSLADVLITGFSRAKQLAVRPTSAVRPFANQSRSSAEIGRELRVGAILEGSVQRLGERLRVNVQLVNVALESPIWAEKFDFKFTDIFDLQDEITLRVVGALPLQLSAAEQRKLTARWTENAEVYRLYLKARFYLPRNDPESLQKAISFFQQTIALAPEAAPAHA